MDQRVPKTFMKSQVNVPRNPPVAEAGIGGAITISFRHRLPILASAFDIEADVRAEIAACLELTLSRPSGDEVYRHEVYRKPGISVPLEMRVDGKHRNVGFLALSGR